MLKGSLVGLPVRGKHASTGLHLPFTAMCCRPLHGTVPQISWISGLLWEDPAQTGRELGKCTLSSRVSGVGQAQPVLLGSADRCYVSIHTHTHPKPHTYSSVSACI